MKKNATPAKRKASKRAVPVNPREIKNSTNNEAEVSVTEAMDIIEASREELGLELDDDIGNKLVDVLNVLGDLSSDTRDIESRKARSSSDREPAKLVENKNMNSSQTKSIPSLRPLTGVKRILRSKRLLSKGSQSQNAELMPQDSADKQENNQSMRQLRSSTKQSDEVAPETQIKVSKPIVETTKHKSDSEIISLEQKPAVLSPHKKGLSPRKKRLLSPRKKRLLSPKKGRIARTVLKPGPIASSGKPVSRTQSAAKALQTQETAVQPQDPQHQSQENPRKTTAKGTTTEKVSVDPSLSRRAPSKRPVHYNAKLDTDYKSFEVSISRLLRETQENKRIKLNALDIVSTTIFNFLEDYKSNTLDVHNDRHLSKVLDKYMDMLQDSILKILDLYLLISTLVGKLRQLAARKKELRDQIIQIREYASKNVERKIDTIRKKNSILRQQKIDYQTLTSRLFDLKTQMRALRYEDTPGSEIENTSAKLALISSLSDPVNGILRKLRNVNDTITEMEKHLV